MNCITIKVPGSITDDSAPTLARDQLTVDDGGGVAFLFDLATTYSWPGGNPTNAAQIKDLSSHSRHGSAIVGASAGITYSGGGFDFSGTSDLLGSVEAPASVSAALRAGSEYWLIAFYIRLPSNGDWDSGGAIRPWFQAAAATYLSQPEICVIGAASSGQAISFRRATGAGTVSEYAVLTPASGDKGALVQLAAWRNASGLGARLKSANGTVSGSAAAGSANSQDFSAATPKWGMPGTFWGTSNNCRKIRIFRGWMENLGTSGRNPTTVLDADYTRTIARGVFS